MNKTPIYNNTVQYAVEHNELDEYRASFKANMACRAAITEALAKHYKDNMQALPNKENTSKKEKMNEETENYNPSSDLALNQVASNMVTSMNNHFASFGTTLEEEKIKDNFKQLLERINKTEF